MLARVRPSGILRAMAAASMAMVPAPHMGSTSDRRVSETSGLLRAAEGL
jgi:hypothetical protein